MEAGDFESSSGGASDSELYERDSDYDEEGNYTLGVVPKLQFRKCTSTARWNDQMGMAEVLEHKGRLWTTMGIVSRGKIFCSIEETLFLTELGALRLLDDNDISLTLKDIYGKVVVGKNGYNWEQFEVYRHLKSLGYVVGRHGIPWSLKNVKDNNGLVSPQGSLETDGLLDRESEDKRSIVGLLNQMQISEARPVFDVYLPNSRFKKSSPGDPNFLLCITRGCCPPSRAEIEVLERQYGGLPLKFCQVEHGHVCFFSFDKIDLPILP